MSFDNFIEKFGGLTESYWFYGNTVELKYDPKEHVYYLVNSNGELEKQAGVTTVCHIIDKSNVLINWACKMMAVKLIKLVHEFYKGAKVLDPNVLEGLILQSKSAHKEKLEEAADIGHEAHAWIEQRINWILNNPWNSASPDHPAPTDERAKNCCRAALDWMHKHNVRWLSTERKIYSKIYRYAGTMDGLAIVDSCRDRLCCPHEYKDRKALIDWKSSNNLYIEYLFQTAAYQVAYTEETNEAIDERWIIRLGKDDGEFEAWHIEESFIEDFEAFKLCLGLYHAVNQINQKVKDKKDTVKQALKEKEVEAKIEALKIKCKNADKYKGVKYPKCNGGNPCQTCLEIYNQRHK